VLFGPLVNQNLVEKVLYFCNNKSTTFAGLQIVIVVHKYLTMSNYFNTQIGLGTSGFADSLDVTTWQEQKKAMHYAFDIGYKVVDTAEMYGGGGKTTAGGRAERMIGEVITERKNRDSLHIVSKVLPVNATKEGTVASCISSIIRLKCDYIDTYLLHWREGETMPLQPVVEAFADLKQRGLIKNYGVSNFPKRWIVEWKEIEKQLGIESSIVTNQVRYHLEHRDPEKYYMDWQHQEGITTMAFSPLGNGSILKNKGFIDVAQRYGYLPAQLAIAWSIRNPMVLAIPKSANADRLKRNFEAQKIELSPEILLELEKKFPL
jgi:diketogulonate reductase-like aldo/keto reductase